MRAMLPLPPMPNRFRLALAVLWLGPAGIEKRVVADLEPIAEGISDDGWRFGFVAGEMARQDLIVSVLEQAGHTRTAAIIRAIDITPVEKVEVPK